MNKKVLVIALVLVLALGSVFAAKKADMKVGAQLGFGARSVTFYGKESLKDNSLNYLNTGFYGAFSFEYGVTEAISIKAEAGINTMGTAKRSLKVGSTSFDSKKESSNTPVNFTIFAGAMYNKALNKELSIYAGAGIDMMVGKLYANEDAKTNAAIGLGAEAGVAYAIDKKLSINAGGKFGWHFVNTNDDVEEAKVGDNHGTTNLTYKFYAGVTYAL